jgi:hypothetical protein
MYPSLSLYTRSDKQKMGWRFSLFEKRMSERRNHRPLSTLLGWSGWTAASAGVLFLVWGYVDREGAPWYLDLAVLVLSIVVPLLFLVGLVGTYIRVYVKGRTQVGWLSSIGFLISVAGAAGWLTAGVVNAPTLYRHLGERVRAAPPGALEECGLCLLPKLYLLVISPLTWLLVGLTMVGLTTVRGEALRNWGLLLLTMALFGWVYQLTDDNSGIVDIRSVHVGFGILFALSWMVLGYALWWSKNKAS